MGGPSRSPVRDRSLPPNNNGSRSPSQSPERLKERNRSPDPREYVRVKPKRDASLSP
ncbi:hypothetical protein HanRHA438_Chr11g0520491 [Helianthus annuus]|nr:hypothetical protein HanRHA438_Chr11g0520491 [Helianthus annuus]